jgi:hypothetical protein
MNSLLGYPVALRCDGLRARPARVAQMSSGIWRVDWVGGLVSLYRADPRGHLALGYEPKHLRWWRPSPQHDETTTSGPGVARGL